MPGAYLNASRSVPAAILFHFIENFSSEFLGTASASRPYRFVMLLAAAVILVWGAATLRGLEAAVGSR